RCIPYLFFRDTATTEIYTLSLHDALPISSAVTREDLMKSFVKLMAGAAIVVSMQTAALAQELVVGVSWSNFPEERWKTDEAAIKTALEAAGAKYISADAQSSASKQLTDVEALISQRSEERRVGKQARV